MNKIENVTIYAKSANKAVGFFKVEKDKVNFDVCTNNASHFKVIRIDSKLGKQYGYSEHDKLAKIILVSPTGLDVDNLVATVDTTDSKNWRIVFVPASENLINASYFKLTRKDSDDTRTGFLWHRNETRNPGEERALRLQTSICGKSLTFSEQKNDPVIITIKKVGEGGGYFQNENEFF